MKTALTLIGVAFLITTFGCPPAPPQPAQQVEETQPEPAAADTADPTPAEPAGEEKPAVAAAEPESKPALKPATEKKALPKLYDFWAVWCPPCREQKPIIEELKKEYAGVVDVIAIDTDKDKELAQKYEIKVIPTLIFVDAEGNEVERLTGLTKKDKLVELFRTHGFIE